MKKALKVTALAFLIASMIIPTKIAMSSSNNVNTTNNDLIAKVTNKVCIMTSLDDSIHPDSGKYPFYTNTDYPTMAITGKSITIDIGPSSSSLYHTYAVQIEGANNYKISIAEGNKVKKNQHYYYECTWTPDAVGIFNIVAYYNNKAVATRKVYVNDTNNKYFQLGNLDISADNSKPKTISTSVTSIPSTYSKNPGKVKLTIGEPLIWSKTLLDASLGDNPSLPQTFSVTEGNENNGFMLNKGIYQVNAYVQGENSIEYEDAKTAYCQKYDFKNLTLTLSKGKKINGSNGYTFTANATGAGDVNLLYAFIVWDQNGWWVAKDYSTEKTFDFTPDLLNRDNIPKGKYRIYVRVKQEVGSDLSANLPNSYEAETYVELPVKEECNKIKINKNIKIYAYKPKTDDQGKNKYTCNKGYAVSHEMNVIDIEASQSNNLQYKVYAVHDGYCYPLCNYSNSKYIPFYPKSSGDYKLIILVKNSKSGSEDDREDLNIKVTDFNEACGKK